MSEVLYPILCPICSAGRESRCRTLRSGRTTDYHAARIEAWYARNRQFEADADARSSKRWGR